MDPARGLWTHDKITIYEEKQCIRIYIYRQTVLYTRARSDHVLVFSSPDASRKVGLDGINPEWLIRAIGIGGHTQNIGVVKCTGSPAMTLSVNLVFHSWTSHLHSKANKVGVCGLDIGELRAETKHK